MGRIIVRIFTRLFYHRNVPLIVTLLCIAFFNSCSTEKAVIERKKATSLGEGVSIYIQKPIINYRDMEDDSPLNPADYNGEEVSKALFDLSKKIMIEKSYNILPDSEHQNYLSLILKLNVYVGPGASWNPLSRKIKSGMTRTVISGSIVDPDDRSHVWLNRVQIRELPDPESEKFREAIQLLFSNLSK